MSENQELRLALPASSEALKDLKAGMRILISGTIYTARDAAHMRLIETIRSGGVLPMSLENQGIYYVGPTPAKEGRPIGSCGPTTSLRMDPMTVALLERGLKVMIGKGERTQVVIDAMKAHGAVYLAATGGAGALLASRVKEKTLVAYEELGAEAIFRLVVEDFPVVVVIDTEGNSAYEIEREKYRSKK